MRRKQSSKNLAAFAFYWFVLVGGVARKGFLLLFFRFQTVDEDVVVLGVEFNASAAAYVFFVFPCDLYLAF